MCVAPAPTSCNPYVCGAGACKTTCATTADCVSPDVCTGTVCSPPATLSVALKAVNITNVQFITINVHLTNNGTSAIPLTQVTVRYWYTLDGGTAAQTPNCDYTFLPGNCASIVYSASSFVTMTTPKATADHYFQFGFTSGAGSLAASGGTTSDMQLRWNKNDFTNFTQTNDYSYNASTTAWVTTTKVTAYLNGALVYGTEP
jgi:hypothetical protein